MAKHKTLSYGNPLQRGKVIAYEAAHTGTEPEWANVESLSDEEFLKRRSRMLNFYNYYLNHQYLMPDVFDWMKANGYTRGDISKIRANPNILSFTSKKLMRAMNMGMPGEHKSYMTDDLKSDRDRVKAEVNQVLTNALLSSENQSDEPPSKSPRELTIDKVNRDVISKLDEMLDDWIEINDNAVEGIDLESLVKAHQVKGLALEEVLKWLNRQFAEVDAAYNKTDEQHEEGYSHLSRSSLRSRHTQLKNMIDSVSKYKEVVKTKRKIKKKKEMTIAQQIKNLKYQDRENELNLISLSPTAIPGKRNVVLFNTKNNVATYVTSSSAKGFSIKGTTIKDVDDSETFSIKLRKPKETLNQIIGTTQSEKACEVLSALTTKKSKFNGRTNEHTIILKSW